jgi:hypothetical protein
MKGPTSQRKAYDALIASLGMQELNQASIRSLSQAWRSTGFHDRSGGYPPACGRFCCTVRNSAFAVSSCVIRFYGVADDLAGEGVLPTFPWVT